MKAAVSLYSVSWDLSHSEVLKVKNCAIDSTEKVAVRPELKKATQVTSNRPNVRAGERKDGTF